MFPSSLDCFHSYDFENEAHMEGGVVNCLYPSDVRCERKSGLDLLAPSDLKDRQPRIRYGGSNTRWGDNGRDDSRLR
jgi:hypothetical protein